MKHESADRSPSRSIRSRTAPILTGVFALGAAFSVYHHGKSEGFLRQTIPQLLSTLGGEVKSQWTISRSTDQMTDQREISARRDFPSDGFIIETTITCNVSTGVVTYTLDAYDSDRNPAAAVRKFSVDVGGHYYLALVRADYSKPKQFYVRNPRYSNEFILQEDSDPIFGIVPDRLTSAKLLKIQLELTQGRPIVEVDQSDINVRDALSPCVSAIQRSDEAARRSQPAGSTTNTLQKPIPGGQLGPEMGTDESSLAPNVAAVARTDRHASSPHEEINEQHQPTGEERVESVAHVQEQTQSQEDLCSSIRRTGAGNAAYERAMGC